MTNTSKDAFVVLYMMIIALTESTQVHQLNLRPFFILVFDTNVPQINDNNGTIAENHTNNEFNARGKENRLEKASKQDKTQHPKHSKAAHPFGFLFF